MSSEFAAKDLPLRDDIRRLGGLVGEMLREQEGEEFFSLVESIRQAAVLSRGDDGEMEAHLAHAIADVPADLREKLIRAFSAYFDAVNMGEQIHRLRRRRDYERKGPQPGGPESVLSRMKRRGIDRETAADMLEKLRIEPVFTAHPTEAVRRTLLTKQQRLARALVDRIEPAALTPKEESRTWARIAEEIHAAWQTEEHFRERPKLEDEVEHVLFYLRKVIYRIIPPMIEAWLGAFDKEYGTQPRRGPTIRFGSWVGGDMDGNPNVGADTIRASLARQRGAILELYLQEVRELIEHLSQSEAHAAFSEALGELVRRREEEFPAVAEGVPERYRDMPYRVLLHCMAAKLKATARGEPRGYDGPGQLISDLETSLDSLRRNHGALAGAHRVQRLIRRVECFGFHFATLDVRQDSEVHRRVCGLLLGDERFADRDAAGRAAALLSAWDDPGSKVDDPQARETLAVFATLREARKAHGRAAVGAYIISMAQGPDDVLAVLYLARLGGLSDGGQVPLDVAPLFETVEDLRAARATLESMLQDPVYRAHLASRGDVQHVMLGYSDSGKDSGIASARWALYRAQEELVEAADAAGIRLVLFHGRGGTVSRGGTKASQAIPGQPPGSVRGRLRVTEQGEIINSRYGLRGIAQRTLEATAGAVLDFSVDERSATPPKQQWRAVMETVAEASRASYRELIHDNDELFEYFRLATPVDVITRMRIGSRPASRRRQRGIDDLRAIPWVFAWTQSRLVLTGWFGAGTGLEAAIREHGMASVQETAREWAVLRSLLGDIEMVMAKADLGIARRFAALAGETGERIYPQLRRAFEETARVICEVLGIDELLQNEQWLARAIRLRNPYIDPMSLTQIELLKEWRAGDRKDIELERALLTSVKGVARGLLNTG